MTDARPFWRQLGVDYFGMKDPNVELRRERTKRIQALQEVISAASQFETLVNAPGYRTLVEQWQEIQASLTRQLVSATPKDFLTLQARLKAFEEAVSIVPNALADAKEARIELERMIDEDFG